MLPAPLKIQTLWSGYGEIRREYLPDGSTVIVKDVHPPARGDFAHRRKVRSYEVERHFYRHYGARCGDACRIPKLVASTESTLLLEDLDAQGFTGRRHRLSAKELELCLSWLAAFHATFLGAAPDGLWEVGTYWHLATRPDELRAMRNSKLRALAPDLDRKLSAAKFQTLVHGDAKPANFCFADSAVAAVDFQYVGGGCGMKDVAYLLGADERGLDFYFECLRARVDNPDLEAEWRSLFPIARADFDRFLDGWR